MARSRVAQSTIRTQPFIAQFVRKLIAERTAGRVSGAILLTHNYNDMAWFQEAASVANAICFTRGRVKFYEPDGTTCAPTQGQTFTYFGNDVEKFANVFCPLGFVTEVLPWTVPLRVARLDGIWAAWADTFCKNATRVARARACGGKAESPPKPPTPIEILGESIMV